jgi:sigma-B regulation protein RsbU (phosphoserine phosphatase)
LFVTAFYGVLDEETGVLTYSNAGHNPPYLFRSRTGEVVPLGITGMPIGIESNTVWGTASIELETGDVLLLYTDGIPDAQNEAGEFFEEQNLVENVKQSLGVSAHDIQANLMRELDAFMGNADQFDDITLMVLSRDIASQNGTPLPLKDIPDTQP